MPAPVPEQLRKTIETLYRSESGRILATLVHLLGDLDLAGEAMHEAFAPPWTPGRRLAYRKTLAPGSYRLRVSRPLTRCASGRDSTPRKETWHSASKPA